MSIQTAASMIDDYFSGGAEPDEIGLTEEEAEIMEQENKKLAAKLYAMANAVCLTIGCEMTIRRWVRDGFKSY
ncbi:hypothetical protein [Vibrio sp. Vb339]|uniref:hypothetical protein n=1 Tax=Vibrio sp. Vb339 TaxID=1192013 RepID=UPI00155603B7|nr:hypothetical protein [Vibrio sp. Vb339]